MFKVKVEKDIHPSEYVERIEKNINKRALNINEGAINPIAIANAIRQSTSELMTICGYGTDEINKYPAVRLMVMQLAHLCNIEELMKDMKKYNEIVTLVEEKLSEREEEVNERNN